MQIITEPAEMQAIAEKLRLNRQLIGVVMTMGALHEGHLALVKLAQKSAGTVILTIFVNPRQFGPTEDLHRYPRPFEQDVALAKSAGVDYLFAPKSCTIYPEHFQTAVQCGSLADRFEGQQRPGHFNGVATVVTKLFNITKPHKAIFGEKDAQQLAIIRQLVADLNLNIAIVGAPCCQGRKRTGGKLKKYLSLKPGAQHSRRTLPGALPCRKTHCRAREKPSDHCERG